MLPNSCSATAGSALLSYIKGGTHHSLSPIASVLSSGTFCGIIGGFSHLFSSSSSSNNRRGGGSSSSSSSSTKKRKQQTPVQASQQHAANRPSSSTSKQQHKQRAAAVAAAAGPWPQPARLVIPDRKASAPVLGRVPPSSRAAAAATASMLRAANPPLPPKAAELTEAPAVGGRVAASPAAEEEPAGSRGSRQAAIGGQPTTAAAAAVESDAAMAPAYPWEVVAALQQSSPYTLHRMAEMDLGTYISYLRDARLGMPSVFELGVAREQGYKGRAQLLRREQLLRHLLLQLQPATAAGGDAGSGGSGSEVQDDLLQELGQEQLAAAAEAAAAAHLMSKGATGDEVGECLLDFFVVKRCMQLMLLQRQHRLLMQQHHSANVKQQQQGSDGAAASTEAAAPLQQPFGGEDVADVDIWDAFFDATLPDYLQYLQAAVAGAPSVFTTVNPHAPTESPHQLQRWQHERQEQAGKHQQQQHAHQQQQNGGQTQQQLVARELLANTAKMLALMPRGMKQRPTLLVGGPQLLSLAAFSRSSVEDVVEVLQDFYKLKRLGFRMAMQELMAVMDEPAHDRLMRL